MATCMEEVLSPFDEKLVIAKSNWSHVSYEHKEPAAGLVYSGNTLDSINVVTLRQARLVPGWVSK